MNENEKTATPPPGDAGAVALQAGTVRARIDSMCRAANTPGADYFDAGANLMIATRELLALIGHPHEIGTATAEASATVHEGWQMVPVKPTTEMKHAIFLNERDANRAWDEALAAAPTPPGSSADAANPVAKKGPQFPRNNVSMKCSGCSHQVEPGEGVLPTDFPSECYHVECQRLSVLTSYSGIPRSTPDADFTVGTLLRQCSCGSRNAEMKILAIDPAKGAKFWVECGDCGATSRRESYRAHAAATWNSQAAPATQPAAIRSAGLENRQIAESLAAMVIEWIDGRVAVDSWKSGLPKIIEARLDRLTAAEPVSSARLSEDDERNAFETWYQKLYPGTDCRRWSAGDYAGRYKTIGLSESWLVWLASAALAPTKAEVRREALEEAAKLCNAHAQKQSRFHQHAEMYVADHLAREIRALQPSQDREAS